MLTKEQDTVAVYQGKYAIVSAVAGSGKSTTLAHRIARLLQDGANPERILALMFNVSACEEFTQRMHALCRERNLPIPQIQTFHAFARSVCTQLEDLCLIPPASLLTEDWQVHALAKDALRMANEEASYEDRIDIDATMIAEFTSLVELIKNKLLFVPSLPPSSELNAVPSIFLRAFEVIEHLRRERKLRTYTDLIYEPTCALMLNPKGIAAVAEQFDAIVVDEYQDTNACQQCFLKFIAGKNTSVIVCGDEDQAIYSFRGASPAFMLKVFEQDYPRAAHFCLSQTFRFGHAVALLANYAIHRNVERRPKLCIATGSRNTTIDLLMYREDGPGAAALQAIAQWVHSGRLLSEVAILVRAHAHSVPVEVSLLTNNVPYALDGADPFFERREVLALRGILMLAVGRLCSVPSIEKRKKLFAAMLTVPSLYLPRESVENLADSLASRPETFIEQMTEFAHSFSMLSYQRDRLLAAISQWSELNGTSPTASAASMLHAIVAKLDLYAYFRRSHARADIAKEKERMCAELIRFADCGNYSVSEFLTLLDQLSCRFESGSQNGDVVTIRTCHRSKGLEHPLVILPDLVDGLFPTYFCDSEEVCDAILEDERRLFYVAVTRAMDKLVLITPHDSRLLEWMVQARTDYPRGVRLRASRFLYESNALLCSALAAQIEKGVPLPAALISKAKSPNDLDVAVQYVRSIGHSSACIEAALVCAERNSLIEDPAPSLLDSLFATHSP